MHMAKCLYRFSHACIIGRNLSTRMGVGHVSRWCIFWKEQSLTSSAFWRLVFTEHIPAIICYAVPQMPLLEIYSRVETAQY